jgi:hypothetical protein
MSRILIALGTILALLVLSETALRQSQRQAREEASALRLLGPLPIAEVSQIEIGAGTRTWRYVLRDSTWRYPAYHQAFVLDQRIDHILKSLLQTPTTFVSAEPGDLPHYGLGPGSPRLILFDAQSRPLLSVIQGRGAPGPRAGESYVKRVGADTIFHLHAHPIHALDARDPPMLDRRVLPKALPRKALQQITFAGDSDYPLLSLRRQFEEIALPTSGMPPLGPTYEWIGVFTDGEKTCVAPSVYAYTDYLKRLTWTALHDPAQTDAFASPRLLYLEYEDGIIDTLALGDANQNGHYLRLHTTNHTLTITPEKADLLFPITSALLDTLPYPTPYTQVEPFSPF